ncbi:AMP-binding protein [Caballeronia concitans]|uniref:AMP-dependent synthetase and ligase n=1 Tax=Caballeronia concitans TaxID=1777133 RepID=A0A658QVG7_9BURK|nr:AMP-binding protein [Caballeronia concitans]SAL25571.1 AMP-dependent synthetase and ligase [Caballeronia concitans]
MSRAEPFIEARDFLLRHRTDYDTAYRDFKWPVLDRFNWALDYFDPMARGNDAPALHIVSESGDETRLSFAQMSERSARVANHLRALNVKRGERILLMLPNRVELWETMLAAMKLGAIVLPATTQLASGDLRERIALGSVQHVIVDAGETHKFDGIDLPGVRLSVGGAREGWLAYDDAYRASPEFASDAETNARDPYLLYFTSGTTSKPKLVAHTHESYPVGHLSTMYWIGLQPGDVHWNISSPGWAKHAWSCFFAPWNAGACVFIYNFSRFDAARTLDALVQHEVTTLCAPPTVWRMLVQEPLASYRVKLREIVGAGEPLNPEVVERVQAAWGVPIRDGYGQTETTAQIANTPGQRLVPGSMSRPLPGYRVVLLDPDGHPADEGEITLALDPPPLGLMTGYADNPAATENAMRGGFYRTSDVAARGADGYFTYIGRADDVFKSSDYRLSPFELESVLIEHEAIAEAAVVPSPDALRLSVPKAFVTLRHGFTIGPDVARSVFAFSRERLAPYKRIRRLEFAELPKTISGKIRRVDLRRHEASRTQDANRGEHEYWEEDFPELRQRNDADSVK